MIRKIITRIKLKKFNKIYRYLDENEKITPFEKSCIETMIKRIKNTNSF